MVFPYLEAFQASYEYNRDLCFEWSTRFSLLLSAGGARNFVEIRKVLAQRIPMTLAIDMFSSWARVLYVELGNMSMHAA